MKLITCGHCGRPYYDNEKACPYCGHAFDHVGHQTENGELFLNGERRTENGELADASTISTPSSQFSAPSSQFSTPSSQFSAPSSQFSPRAETIAAITANTTIEADIAEPLSDPNQIETTLPARRKRTLLWIVITLAILAAIAAAYFYLPIKELIK